jgi:RNA polymerase sigma-70 factor (ECF subfamily)
MNAWAFPIRPARTMTPARADRDFADVRLAAGGDAAAFGRLYWQHAARIKALARRLVGPADAEDGTQEVFVRAWRRLHQFRADSTFGTWLHRLAVNVLLRELERGRRHRSEAAPLETIAADPEPGTDVDLERALATLPAGIREVVVLHDMENYTHDEIGQLLGIGLSASKMRLHRGRSALRALLAGGERR